MLTPNVRERSDVTRRAYRREMREALQLGVPETVVADVVGRFAGEAPDPDTLRCALQQYVPARMYFDDADNAHRP